MGGRLHACVHVCVWGWPPGWLVEWLGGLLESACLTSRPVLFLEALHRHLLFKFPRACFLEALKRTSMCCCLRPTPPNFCEFSEP